MTVLRWWAIVRMILILHEWSFIIQLSDKKGIRLREDNKHTWLLRFESIYNVASSTIIKDLRGLCSWSDAEWNLLSCDTVTSLGYFPPWHPLNLPAWYCWRLFLGWHPKETVSCIPNKINQGSKSNSIRWPSKPHMTKISIPGIRRWHFCSWWVYSSRLSGKRNPLFESPGCLTRLVPCSTCNEGDPYYCAATTKL